MWEDEITGAQKLFQNKIKSLQNDFARAFYPLRKQILQPSPFPITMYAMSILDLFSSYEAGKNEGGRQTIRLVRYLTEYMGYEEISSRILVQFHRHQLMHTSEPRLIKSKRSKAVYGWHIGDKDTYHMKLRKDAPLSGFGKDVFFLHFSLTKFISDLEKASIKYLERLAKDPQVQLNFKKCEVEIKTKSWIFRNLRKVPI